MNEFLLLMKHELVLTVLIFLLLFIRIGKGMKNESLLSLIQVLLLVSLLIGFFFNKAFNIECDSNYFSGVERSSSL